jgi:hypothetical protein
VTRRLGLALAGALWLLPAAAQALPPETWVVAFANNHGEPGEVTLRYAERDAQQLVEALQSQGEVEPRRTVLIPDASADAVRQTLLEVNARIRERSGSGPTALVVFYSGHADADALHLDGTQLRMEELRALVQGSPAAMRLLVVDACRSGTVTRVKGVTGAPSFEIHLLGEVAAEGLAIVTSSAAGESSQESDELRGSFFTHHLVNALRGAADQNGDGAVTLAEAYAYTYTQTLRSSGSTLALQHPTYAYDVRGKGEVVLTRSSALARRMGRLRLAEAAPYLVLEGRRGGPVVAEVVPVRAQATLSLAAGPYFVQERLAAEYREYEVDVKEGEELALESRPHRDVRYDRLVRKGSEDKTYTQGVSLLGGARGETLSGEGVVPQLQLGYGLDLPWLSLGARLRGSTAASGGVLPRRHDELGLGLTLQRFVDFDVCSVSFGLLAEAIWHRQTFSGSRAEPARDGAGGAFGGILSVERHLWDGLAVHLEGGPVTLLLEQSKVQGGAEVGQSLFTPFTWWAAGGLVYRR